MKIKTTRVVKLSGHNVYIRNIGKIFEYLLVIDKEIYTAHIIVTKKFWWRDYPKKVTDNVCKLLLQMASATIETVAIMKKTKNTKIESADKK
jgi:hypothetical protein